MTSVKMRSCRMKKEGRYLVMIHGLINKDGQPDVSWDYAVDPIVESYHVVGETSFPSIGEIYCEAATWPERELNELFGFTLDPGQGPDHGHSAERTGGEESRQCTAVRGGESMSYIVPIGPYHPALEEPIHAKLYTEGEMIKDAEVFVGYNHRGIEKLATERNAIQTLVLVERVCGICSHSHAFTYAMCVEELNGIEAPKRGEYIRVITAELERLHSHFLWLGIACHIIGHDSMFMHIWDERELVMDLLEELTGNRVNYAMCTVGGARRDVSDDLRRRILEACDKLKAPLDRITEIALTDKTIAMRTKGVGILTREDALKLGAVGPHARASGVNIDVRKDAPYSAYGDFEFDVPVVDSGDVFARVVVRALECYESIKIIRQALENLPEGPINLGNKLPKIKAGQTVKRHEAPRGQLSYMLAGNDSLNNYRISIHVPSFKNTPTVPHMLRNNTVADAGLIIASIDPCFSCLDR